MSHETPDYHSHEEFVNRSRKLEEIKKQGIEPYPHKFSTTHSADELQKGFGSEEVGHSEDAAAGSTKEAVVSGRLVLFRAMGKNAFGHIQDHTGRIQLMFNRDLTIFEGYSPDENQPKPLKFIEKHIDLGDIIGVEGNLFHTQKGELTIFVKKMTLLSKTLLPLADKHAGLADKELRYRKRWLDLVSDTDVQKVFRARSLILKLLREVMEQEKFIEVETPVLQSIYGGAEARPFTTELHALHQEMFLRISLEIPLKKLIVGGMHRVFEIGRVFRNEGIDRNHNPEFTLFEAYAEGWDYNDMMELTENLVAKLALELHGSTKIPAIHPESNEAIEIDVKTPWPRLTMKEAIEKFGNLDFSKLSDEQIKQMLLDSGHVAPEKLPLMSHGLLVAALFEVYAEPHLINPHHIIDHPQETTPLCKPHRTAEGKTAGLVERFESFILGSELCNAYSELNDPVLQRELLVAQAARKDAGDEEASPLDEEFIESICQGMPPAGGLGIGIDRLVMILTNQHSIRDVLFFPWMKPEQEI